ncbi:MAG: TadE/TadG family type IV pilus assembly protein, partial [Candidatus Velthaea sp.]
MKLTNVLTEVARDEHGHALAETVVILPMLVLLVVGLIEVGRFGDYTVKVANAARAGVQYGAQNDIAAADTAGMQTAALNDAQNVGGLSATAFSFCQCADGSA